MASNSENNVTTKTTSFGSIRIGAIALILGAVLNLIRMIPVLLSEGYHSNSLPPGQTAALTAETALLGGWYISHILAIISVPLFIYGFWTIYQLIKEKHNDSIIQHIGLAGLSVLTLSGILYISGAILDGIALGTVSHNYILASGLEKDILGSIVMAVTELAAAFGAHYMIFAMIGTGILALSLKLSNKKSWHPLFGILIGILSVTF